MADVKHSHRHAKPKSAAAVGKQSSNANAEEGDDIVELQTESQTKIDINTLKNDILTDGMQVRVAYMQATCS